MPAFTLSIHLLSPDWIPSSSQSNLNCRLQTSALHFAGFAHAGPNRRVHEQRRDLASRQIDKTAVIADSPVTEQAGSRARTWFARMLFRNGCCRWSASAALRWQAVALVRAGVNDRGKQLINTWQTPRPVLPVLSKWLPQHKLAAVLQIARVEKVVEAPRLEAHDSCQSRASRPGIDAGNQRVRIWEVLRRPHEVWCRYLVDSPKQVQKVVNEHHRVI